MNGRISSLMGSVSLVLGCVGANAASVANDAPSTCTTLNCGATPIKGLYLSENTPLGRGNTWVYQVVAVAGECLRLEVKSSVDLEMAVVSPDPAFGGGVGNIWADDDSAGSAQPLVKIDPVPRSGYYTIIVSAFSVDTPSSSFNLLYGRYPTLNMNCAPPTSPGENSSGSEVESHKQQQAAQ